MFNAAVFVRKWSEDRAKSTRSSSVRWSSTHNPRTSSSATWTSPYTDDITNNTTKPSQETTQSNIQETSVDLIISLQEKLPSDHTYHTKTKKQAEGCSKTLVANGTQRYSPVVYKSNEDRFTQNNFIKLKTFSSYKITLEVNLDQVLVHCTLGGKNYNCFRMYNRPNGGVGKMYEFVWNTDRIRKTERHHRTMLPLAFKFNGYHELRFHLLVKFYGCDERTHYRGEILSGIHISATLGKNNKIDRIFID